jgi:uncharacterized protein YceH (UPF0502 family)
MLEEPLRETEVRVLGCLIEKEMTTPESYPLSVNALANACNQKSNRLPLMAVTEDDVTRALYRLRFMNLSEVSSKGGRVLRYQHVLPASLGLKAAELAVICELLVRGPQTPGELRTRCERMYPFDGLSEIEAVLKGLAERPEPLVMCLPRQPGRKEARHTHLFAGKPDITEEEALAAPEPARKRVLVENERLVRAEEHVAALREEIANLRRQAEEFKAQFE